VKNKPEVMSEKLDIVLGVSDIPDSLYGVYDDANKVSILEGSMEAVRTAVKEGRTPTGKVIFTRNAFVSEYGTYGFICEAPLSFYLYGGYIYASCITIRNPCHADEISTVRFEFNEDGKVEKVYHFYLPRTSMLGTSE
jgi:hypothetical protein